MNYVLDIKNEKKRAPYNQFPGDFCYKKSLLPYQTSMRNACRSTI